MPSFRAATLSATASVPGCICRALLFKCWVSLPSLNNWICPPSPSSDEPAAEGKVFVVEPSPAIVVGDSCPRSLTVACSASSSETLTALRDFILGGGTAGDEKLRPAASEETAFNGVSPVRGRRRLGVGRGFVWRRYTSSAVFARALSDLRRSSDLYRSLDGVRSRELLLWRRKIALSLVAARIRRTLSL